MQDQRVLVTGGAGFIGSTLANHLAEDNDVVAVDNTYLGTPANLIDDVEFVDASVLEDGLPADVDALFHLAALSSRNMHEEDPNAAAVSMSRGSSTPSSRFGNRGTTPLSTPRCRRSTGAEPNLAGTYVR